MAVLTADIGSHLCRDVGGDELIVFVHVEPTGIWNLEQF